MSKPFIPSKLPNKRLSAGGHVTRTGPVEIRNPVDVTPKGPVMQELPENAIRTAEGIEFKNPEGRLPGGWLWMWNRLGQKWEHPFDGSPIVFEPFEFKPVTSEQADFLWAHCIIQYNLDGDAVRVLAIEGEDGWLEPLEKPEVVELFGRENEDAGQDVHGEQTRPVTLEIGAPPIRHGGHGAAGRAFNPAVRKGVRGTK